MNKYAMQCHKGRLLFITCRGGNIEKFDFPTGQFSIPRFLYVKKKKFKVSHCFNLNF
jgi:hypothetical protein